MRLQQQLAIDLKEAMKARETERTGAIRILLGEFGRQREKELDDGQVIAIIKKLIKSERELIAAKGEEESSFIAVMESYLPKQATEEEIRTWIAENINFAELGNKMQAMRPIMAHFGAAVDGNTVKSILAGIE